MIDTDKAIQELAEGDSFTEEQARRIVRIVARADERAATTKDLERTKDALQGDLGRLRTDLSADLESAKDTLKGDMELLSKDVDRRFAESEARMTRRIYTAIGALAALLAVFEFLV